MRKLQLQDIFKASRLLVSLDLKEEFKEIGLKSDKIEDIAAKGFDVFWTIFEKASSKNAENSIYEFLSGIFECTSEEVKTILEEDPELTEPGHHILQKKMMQFQEEQLSKMNL